MHGAVALAKGQHTAFRVREDPETGQTIASGMGELHLEVVTHRLLTDYKVDAKIGKPQVVYREIEDLSHTYPRDENSKILDWLIAND